MSRFLTTFTLVSCSLLGFVSLAHAQSEPNTDAPRPAVVDAPVPAPGVLSVPLPPNARLRFDLDAQDEDVLGVVKSLLRGFNGSSLKGVLNSSRKLGPQGSEPNDLGTAATLQMLSDTDLQTMLRDVHHLRAVFFETPNAYGSRASQIKMSQSVLSYYQAAYISREGGRRVMRGDFDDVQMLGVGFRERGFAYVFQAPGFGMVLRADGYPNFEGIGPAAMAGFLLFTGRVSSSPTVVSAVPPRY